MRKRSTGAELALMHVRFLQFGQASLAVAIPVVLAAATISAALSPHRRAPRRYRQGRNVWTENQVSGFDIVGDGAAAPEPDAKVVERPR